MKRNIKLEKKIKILGFVLVLLVLWIIASSFFSVGKSPEERLIVENRVDKDVEKNSKDHQVVGLEDKESDFLNREKQLDEMSGKLKDK